MRHRPRSFEDRGGRSPLIIKDLDLYPQPPTNTRSPTLNSEEPNKDDLSRSHMCTGCELERGEGTREACSVDLTGMSTCDLEETAR